MAKRFKCSGPPSLPSPASSGGGVFRWFCAAAMWLVFGLGWNKCRTHCVSDPKKVSEYPWTWTLGTFSDQPGGIASSGHTV